MLPFRILSPGYFDAAAASDPVLALEKEAPIRQNPNQVLPMGDGLGFCVFFGYDFKNGVKRRLEGILQSRSPPAAVREAW